MVVAVSEAKSADVGNTEPLVAPKLIVRPFMTVGLIDTPFVFLLTAAVSVEVWLRMICDGEAVSVRSMRGSALNEPVPVWQPVAFGKPSQPHQLFCTVAVPPV